MDLNSEELGLLTEKLVIENCFIVRHGEKIRITPKPYQYEKFEDFMTSANFKNVMPLGKRIRFEFCFDVTIWARLGHITSLGLAQYVADIDQEGNFEKELQTHVMKEIENDWIGRVGERKFKSLNYCDIEPYKRSYDFQGDVTTLWKISDGKTTTQI